MTWQPMYQWLHNPVEELHTKMVVYDKNLILTNLNLFSIFFWPYF